MMKQTYGEQIGLKIEHSPSRWTYPVQASLKLVVNYNTPSFLEGLINHYVDRMSLSWKDYFTNPHKVLRSWINPSLTLNIAIPDEKELPASLEKTLRHIGRKHPNISSIMVTHHSNTNELMKRLKAVLETRDKEVYRRTRKLKFAIAIPAFLGSIFLGMGMAPLAAAWFVIKEAITGTAILSLRQWYLDSAAKHFSKKQQIRDTNDHRVLTALEKGTRSVGWGHYFLSCFSYSALKHPRVFAAGMELALEGKQKQVDLIHEKYANRMR